MTDQSPTGPDIRMAGGLGPEHEEPFLQEGSASLRIALMGPSGTVETGDLRRVQVPAPGTAWIRLVGAPTPDLLEALESTLAIAPGAIAAIYQSKARPQMEDRGDYLLMLCEGVAGGDLSADALRLGAVAIVLGAGYVVTVESGVGSLLDPLFDEIVRERTRARHNGADFLLYMIMDALVDGYIAGLDAVSERIEDLDETLITQPSRETLRIIHRLKRELLLVRRSLWPVREILGWLERGGSDLIDEATRRYLRDVHDHTVTLMDAIELQRDVLAGMVDIYLSSLSNRMNEIMKVLTIMSTLFMPLTFIAGVYGMNFRFMPELQSRWGYPVTLAVMFLTFVGMIAFFRRKGWI